MPCVPARRSAAEARQAGFGDQHGGCAQASGVHRRHRGAQHDQSPVGRQLQPAVVATDRQVGIERGQPTQAPDGKLRDRHRIEHARRHEGERRRYRRRSDPDRAMRCSGWAAWPRWPMQPAAAAGRRAGSPGGGTVSLPDVSAPRRACRTWNTRPPVTGLASASRTSTSCARRKT